VHLLLNALTHIAIASTIAHRHSSILADTSLSPTDRLRRTIELQATSECQPTNHNDPQNTPSIDPNSPAAILGRKCVPHLLQHLALTPTSSLGDADLLQKCTDRLSHCAEWVPSVYAPDLPLLTSSLTNHRTPLRPVAVIKN